MHIVTYDQEAYEQTLMQNRANYAQAHMNEPVDLWWDDDQLGFRALADSEFVLRQFHQIGFSTFEWVGVKKVGNRYMTRFRLR